MSIETKQAVTPIRLEAGFYSIAYSNGEIRHLKVKPVDSGYPKGKLIVGYLEGSQYVYFGVIN